MWILVLMLATRALFTGTFAALPEPPQLHPPTDDSWTHHGIFLTPEQSFELTALHEPTVLYEDGTFRVWYGGGWDTQAIGYAECSGDPTDPGDWEKHTGPVWGGGGSSISGERNLPEVIKLGSFYYGSAIAEAYEGGQSMVFAHSSDGLSWTEDAGSISLPSGRIYWGNRTVWREGDDWYMLAEAGPLGWAIYLYTSSDGLSWSIANGGSALSSLQVAGGGMYGGPSLLVDGDTQRPKWDDDLYHLWYHAAPVSGNSPTNIYHATSPDLINWTKTGVVLLYSDLPDVDQVADPQVVLAGSTAYLVHDTANNAEELGEFGIASATAS